jgi:RHS repeat-associated protein
MHYIVDPAGLGNIAAEYDGAGNLLVSYEHGYGLLTRIDSTGNSLFYTFAAIGHTSEMTDQGGATVNRYAFDPFGIPRVSDEVISNGFGFVGEFGVTEEGTGGGQFMRSRMYFSHLGRFASEDPIGLERSGPNLLLYV